MGDSGTSIDVGTNDLGWGELLTSDGGGTYEYASGAKSGGGTTIHHNWVHNCWAGIYVDQNQNNYIVYRNVCYSNYAGILCNMFTNNLIINNTSLSNTTDIEFNGSSDVAVTNINNLWHSFTGAYGSTVVKDDGWYPPISSNYVLMAGSAGIHGGQVYPVYAPGYNGLPPDVGAYQNGETWTPGANFTARPFPNFNALPSSMSIQQSGTNVTVSWTNGFLQQATSVAGPWTELTNTISPYTFATTNTATFFRSTLLPPQ